MPDLGPRYLPWLILGAAVTVGAALRPAGRTPGAAAGDRATPPASRQVHYVTPRQLAGSNAMVARHVDWPEATAHDGRRMRLEDLSAGRPLVVAFVKDGCPCNVEFEPFFLRLERLYAGSARFARVIDAGPEAAARYAREMHPTGPVLADPDRTIIRRLGAENGGYIALLTPDGVIDGFWPGCSADGMADLGRRIARLAGTEERPLDLAGMPGPLTTGCPFEL